MKHSFIAIAITSLTLFIAVSVAAQAISIKGLWLSIKFYTGHSGAFSAVAWLIILSWRSLVGIYSPFK